MRVCGEEEISASMSISRVVEEALLGEEGSRFEILKMALSFPGPMPPRNLNVGSGVEEGREMYTAAAVSGGSSMPV